MHRFRMQRFHSLDEQVCDQTEEQNQKQEQALFDAVREGCMLQDLEQEIVELGTLPPDVVRHIFALARPAYAYPACPSLNPARSTPLSF
jgi:hypothetical protein